MRLLALAVLATLAQHATAPRRLGRALAPGMTLVYATDGAEQPWRVESVDTAAVARDGAACVTLRLDMGRGASTRVLCEATASDGVPVMTAWDSARGTHQALRPLGAGAVHVRRPDGSGSTFTASAPVADSLDGIALTLVPTEVVTRDTSGRAVRRLRERFAIELATARDGTFEVPDSLAAGGWRVERRFALARIERR